LVAVSGAWAGGQADAGEGEGVSAVKQGEYGEAPMLAALVTAGALPPVGDRLPEDLLVVEPIEKTGKYGGTINVFATDNLVWQDLQWGAGLPDGLFRMNREATNIEPNLAKDFVLSEDHRSFRLSLRRGVKWSDGEPFSADDVVFWFEDIVKVPGAGWDMIYPPLEKAVKIDNGTVRLEFSEPFPAVVAFMSQWPSWRMFQPKHYLQKWHLTYNDQAEAIAKEEGFETWQEALSNHYGRAPQTDLDLPLLDAWVLKNKTTTTKLFERNPFYWKVDSEGNQLPYIDRILVTIVDKELYPLKAISGEADYAFTSTSFADYTLFKENEAAGNYRVILLPGSYGNDVSVGFNLTYPDNEIRQVFQDVRFRQAMSLAINRSEINDVAFHGKAVPRQATVFPFVSYYKSEWGEANAQYDTAGANRLLDEVGLDKKDRDGFRLLPSGKPLEIVVEYSDDRVSAQKTLELIEEYWESVGVKVLIKFMEYALFYERERGNDHMARAGWTSFADEIGNYSQGHRFFATHGALLNFASPWDSWLDASEKVKTAKSQVAAANTADDKAAAEKELAAAEELLSEASSRIPDADEPPKEFVEINELFTQRRKTAIGSADYRALSEKIGDFHAKNLWMIGTVGMAPRILIAQNNLRNVPGPEYVNRGVLLFDVSGYFYQYFFE
jgi:peptide/nickel transport system substrate-binding protein